ncbi:MAG: MBL fold metallo-hydrolase [Oscillospiraceae bacterium]|nr:MBL fold metallo-hydrolase [Oscillospiraceae bacterium]
MTVETLPVGYLGTNCYIVHDGKAAVVIDPGDDVEKILETVRGLSLSVKYIFLTHAHFDHTLAAAGTAEMTGAVICAASGEFARLSDPVLSGSESFPFAKFIPLSVEFELSEKTSLKVGELSFEFIETPGHTEGSICIVCGDTIFAGDTLFYGSCGRCDLPGGNFEDMMKSLKKLYELPGDFKVLPGHGEATTLSRERRYNPYMAEAVRN